MPGQNYSESYEGLPICECNHAQGIHKNCTGKCEGFDDDTVTPCKCRKFKEIPFDKSELGKAVNELLKEYGE